MNQTRLSPPLLMAAINSTIAPRRAYDCSSCATVMIPQQLLKVKTAKERLCIQVGGNSCRAAKSTVTPAQAGVQPSNSRYGPREPHIAAESSRGIDRSRAWAADGARIWRSGPSKWAESYLRTAKMRIAGVHSFGCCLRVRRRLCARVLAAGMTRGKLP